jgi:pimeloyl-ACP methyl ester carboxylesterase
MRHARKTFVSLLPALALAAGVWLYTPDRPRAELEAAYAAPPSSFLDVAGTRLHLRDTGPRDAPPVVLLHGFASSLHTWEGWASRLDDGHRVIRFDLPGFGLTGEDSSGDYTDQRAIEIIAGLMDRLGLSQAALVGNSMGGRIAWRFALHHPERVSRLVLVAPDGFATDGMPYGRVEVPPVVRVLPFVMPMPLLRIGLAPTYADSARLTEDTVQRYHDMMVAPGVRSAILQRMEQMVIEDPTPLLRQLRTPTLLLWGEKDAVIPFGKARDFLAALPDARLVALPALGHLPQEEAPADSLSPVLAFLTPQRAEAAAP